MPCARSSPRNTSHVRVECPIVKTQGSAILIFLTTISLFLLLRGNEHNISNHRRMNQTGYNDFRYSTKSWACLSFRPSPKKLL